MGCHPLAGIEVVHTEGGAVLCPQRCGTGVVIPWRGWRWFTQYQFGVNIDPVPLFRCHPLAGIEVVHTTLWAAIALPPVPLSSPGGG